jgi:hypothetical protein
MFTNVKRDLQVKVKRAHTYVSQIMEHIIHCIQCKYGGSKIMRLPTAYEDLNTALLVGTY